MLTKEQGELIRHKVLVERHGIRRTAAELGLCRNTVRKYLPAMEPSRPRPRSRSRPVWARIKPRLDELLAQVEASMTMDQRLTAGLLHRQLVAEGYRVSAGLIRNYLRERRSQRQEVDRSSARIGGPSTTGALTAHPPSSSNPVADFLALFAPLVRRVQAQGGLEVEPLSETENAKTLRVRALSSQPKDQPQEQMPTMVKSPGSGHAQVSPPLTPTYYATASPMAKPAPVCPLCGRQPRRGEETTFKDEVPVWHRECLGPAR
jgi:hypothetical protein